jgi:pyridoxal 5'-phosphate synthase pdxT subunit
LEDGSVVGVATETLLGVAFHPEVSGDSRLHKMFLHDMVRSRVSRPAPR